MLSRTCLCGTDSPPPVKTACPSNHHTTWCNGLKSNLWHTDHVSDHPCGLYADRAVLVAGALLRKSYIWVAGFTEDSDGPHERSPQPRESLSVLLASISKHGVHCIVSSLFGFSFVSPTK